MTSKNIGWHTRSWTDGTKIQGGSFGGDLSLETANRLIKYYFEVEITNTGTPVFVDKRGRRVWLYTSVDAASTEKGRAALRAWQALRNAADAANEALTEQQDAEIAELIGGLSHEEAVRRLKGEV